MACLLIVASSFTLALGITQPLMRFDKLFLFEETPSLIAIITALYHDGDAALAGIVALVSIVFPMAKIALIAALLAAPANANTAPPRWTTWLGALAKWSMMDVMLVALAIFAAKTSGLAQAVSQPGLWFYAASALLGAIASTLARKPKDGADTALT
ncbi:MAG: paraquat-inducible protein A [Ahrensia sp.]